MYDKIRNLPLLMSRVYAFAVDLKECSVHQNSALKNKLQIWRQTKSETSGKIRERQQKKFLLLSWFAPEKKVENPVSRFRCSFSWMRFCLIFCKVLFFLCNSWRWSRWLEFTDLSKSVIFISSVQLEFSEYKEMLFFSFITFVFSLFGHDD